MFWTELKIKGLNLLVSWRSLGFSVYLIFWASNYFQYNFSFKYIVIFHNMILKLKVHTLNNRYYPFKDEIFCYVELFLFFFF